MKKVLFIDRDGTIITEPEDEIVDSLEKFRFRPGAICSLARLTRETDYELVMVTNQDGLGAPSFPEESFWPPHNKMLQILSDEGICFAEIFIDRTWPEEKAPTRKPGTAMLVKYLSQGVDLENSYVIGDRLTDLELAKNLGCNAIFFGNSTSPDAVFSTMDWNEIYKYLKSKPRTATVKRKTRETDIHVSLNIDGSGRSDIKTGIGFFDHMLDQIARHGGFDLTINAAGDLNVDAHHLTEDLAICLGEAFYKALGSKKGIERYSFVLPMDDCLAQVAADLGGRPWLEWEAEFSNANIGEMPAEMFFHFFKSFCDNARCNLNIKAEGMNDHHKAESIFKAFARALKGAVKMTDNFDLPSTKGKL
ncbi:MAG TPA: bifunctional histidinol-phosphatase/imidazoleglycerol-phosphate dehydratase [Bacteroidales bacterium]|nr:bifunctional histidinol-phosphatase/imidazoleglycerol-phosphate dehydratase [Bacteroidales bacterium]